MSSIIFTGGNWDHYGAGNGGWNPSTAISGAYNVDWGQNPAYASSDFLTFFPQFNGVIDLGVLSQFITVAQATISKTRWCDFWELGMHHFIAHHCEMYLRSSQGTMNTSTVNTIASGTPSGQQTSFSAGGISVGTDFSAVNDDLKGWSLFKTTSYGQQYAAWAKLFNKAPMQVR